MNILGIHDGHNASSTYINKNTILANSEERFKRIKNYRGFPEESIRYILNKVTNVDEIKVGSVFRRRNKLLKIRDFQNKLRKNLVFIYHHLSHSYLYKLSDFKECLVISLDGSGDGLSFLASIGKDDLEVICESSYLDSVGDFYASITELLGFKPMEDEGKVMSLSSFTSDYYFNLKVIDYIEELKSFRNFLDVVGSEATKKLKSLLNLDNLDFNKKVGVAKYAQKVLEEVVLKAINHLSSEYNIENIVFTGGVAQNVKLNSKIAENFNLFVPPFMGDEGLSFGAVLSSKYFKRLEIKNTYFGYKIENERVDKILTSLNSTYKYTYLENKEIPEIIGEKILDNKVVCIARDEMEFGPRALGNRSIIALPTKENRERINKILGREWFMPFAPTILYEYVDDYLINPKYSPFMTLLFKVREERVKEIEGVVHVDKTTRPQTLKRESNPLYYDIINYINENINLPVVLNTSFNLHGEPIVCREVDALKSFKFDYLLLGNYLIEKV
ncbi:carbamoyltransferase C-terminal domain-containing protein [Methanocaldococcus indicus]|uniref:carbamoyltransferase C-terminal domain-containing protein n=1 Tax=Methanocaldococcus indicus TaxID=213231 RepID=UPI003C6CF73A